MSELDDRYRQLSQEGGHFVLIATFEGQFELAHFDSFHQCPNEDVRKLLATERLGPAGLLGGRFEDCGGHFFDGARAIQELIRSGVVYQVNLTMSIEAQYYGSPLDIYARLRERQPTEFGSFIECSDWAVASLSPELFVRHEGETLSCRPMKGTASVASERGLEELHSEKNHAENLMIVDLVRNDLGRLCQIGSVKVSDLFKVEVVGSVYQMTSSVCGALQKNCSLRDILSSLFPCGSVVGAPKIKALETIRQLETNERGVYCGMIGWLEPFLDGEVGNFCFSVPIRTVFLEKKNYRATLGVGSGIVYDSDAALELQECHLKAQFFTDLPAQVGLIETLPCYQNLYAIRDHVRRLERSSVMARIPCNRIRLFEWAKSELLGVNKSLVNGNSIFRVELLPEGVFRLVIREQDQVEQPVAIKFAEDLLGQMGGRVVSCNPLLVHKVNYRPVYDRATDVARNAGLFDLLFLNELGHVTEGSRTNIFIRKGVDWFTPPIRSGVLPGIQRARLMNRLRGAVTEMELTKADVEQADEVVLTNAVRGSIRAKLLV